MITLSAIDDSGNVLSAITFNRTFTINQLRNAFDLGAVRIPRAHGSRLLQTPYLTADDCSADREWSD